MDLSNVEKVWHRLHVRREISNFFKVSARYLYLAFVAMVALNVEGYIRAVPGNLGLYYVAYGLAAVGALGMFLLRRSKRVLGYRRIVLGATAWSAASIGFFIVSFPLELVQFFSVRFPLLSNVALAIVIALELAFVGTMFRLADLLREVETDFESRWRKKRSTPDWDAILAVEEFA